MSALCLDELAGIGDAVIDVRLDSALADVGNSDAVTLSVVVGQGDCPAGTGSRRSVGRTGMMRPRPMASRPTISRAMMAELCT